MAHSGPPHCVPLCYGDHGTGTLAPPYIPRPAPTAPHGTGSAATALRKPLTWAQQLRQLPYPVATPAAAASDLLPFAYELGRTLGTDRLWVRTGLPSGGVLIDATPSDVTERTEPPEDLLRATHGAGFDGPTRLARQALPDGWRAGVHVPLRAPDGRGAGHLLLGWTRRCARWAAARTTRGVASLALADVSRSLGGFWAEAWSAHRAERERARLSAVIDHCAAAVLTLDPQGRVTTWNAAMRELTGLRADDALGRRTGELFALTREDGSALSLPDTSPCTVRLTSATGWRRWVEIFCSPPAEASAGALTVVFLDRSAKRRLEDTRQLMLASIQHELKTPLTMIRGHAQLLHTTASKEDEQRSLEAIVQATEIMDHVVGDLAGLTADPTAGSATALEDVEAAPLLRRTVTGVLSASARTVVSAEPGVVVRADPIRLRECVLLILDNAEKYAPHGKITVTARRAGAEGVIDIADEGPGIPAAERRRALQPYYRLPALRNLPGSGLGLHIAQTMLNAMRGRLELSEAPSGGLKVSLRLPLSAPGRAVDAPPPPLPDGDEARPPHA